VREKFGCKSVDDNGDGLSVSGIRHKKINCNIDWFYQTFSCIILYRLYSGYRIRMNHELNDLIKNADIVR
jgi:hypothetical protein